MKKFISFYLLGVMVFTLNAQINEKYFNDTLQKGNGIISKHLKYKNTIIFAGNTFGIDKYQPSIVRVDTLGNIIWTTTDNDTNHYVTRYASVPLVEDLIIGNDDNIYAICNSSNELQDQREVWKVNPNSGFIVWRKPFNLSYPFLANLDVEDYDSTKFIVTYETQVNLSQKSFMAYVSKSTGDTLAKFKLGDSNGGRGFPITVDNHKNIYFSISDSIFKVSGINPENRIWKIKDSSILQSRYSKMYFDSVTSAIYLMGYKKTTSNFFSGQILKLNQSNGAFISRKNAGDYDTDCEEFKVKNGFIYITWRQLYVGAGTHRFSYTKYKMQNATIVWDTVYMFVNPSPVTLTSQSGMSLDIDNQDGVYITGYYAANNYGPGIWSILKLNGVTGDTLYHKSVAEDSVNINTNSIGKVTCVINNKPYFLGELQFDFASDLPKSAVALVKIDPLNGNILLQKFIGGKYQFMSKTVAIQNYGSNTILLKQIGKKINVEMLDINKNLIWKKIISKSDFLLGHDIKINQNTGRIIISAYSKKESYINPPFQDTVTDSIYVFQLNSASGAIVNEHRFITSAFSFPIYDFRPVEVMTDALGIFVLYQENKALYLRKISGNSVSSELNLNLFYRDVLIKTKYMYSKNSTQLAFFGNNGTLSPNATVVDKNTMMVVNSISIPNDYAKVNYILELTSNTIVVCGRTFTNSERLGLYNTATHTNVWTNAFTTSNQSQILKCTTDANKSSIYTIGYRAQNIDVRKISAASGQLLWTYSYNGSSNQADYPLDLAYDEINKQILVSGFTTSGINRNALILMLDTAGNPLDTIIKQGDFAGNNYATCVNIMPDGTRWVGGNLNKNPYGFAGFTFEVNPSISNIVSNDLKNNQIKIYPNPSSNLVKVEWHGETRPITIEVYNLFGQKIISNYYIDHQNLIINTQLLKSGNYFLRILSNNKIIGTEKLVVVN